MDINSAAFKVASVVLCCIVPFIIYQVVMFSWSRKLGNWYVNRTKELTDRDRRNFIIRNILYPWSIMGIFLIGIISYIFFRPSFVDPSWLCILFVGVVLMAVLFQGFQYAWLYYRTRDSKKK